MGSEKNKCTLMTTAEYMKVREDAIRRLNEVRYVDETFCDVDKQRVMNKEKDQILAPLVGGYEYLEVPQELYLGVRLRCSPICAYVN